MANLDLSKYGIVDVKEIVHNPSYDVLFAEETKPSLEGFEKGQVTELGAVNVMTGINEYEFYADLAQRIYNSCAHIRAHKCAYSLISSCQSCCSHREICLHIIYAKLWVSTFYGIK